MYLLCTFCFYIIKLSISVSVKSLPKADTWIFVYLFRFVFESCLYCFFSKYDLIVARGALFRKE